MNFLFLSFVKLDRGAILSLILEPAKGELLSDVWFETAVPNAINAQVLLQFSARFCVVIKQDGENLDFLQQL